MSIASRIEQIEQHLTDDYSVLTLAGADLTNVDKNIENLKQSWEERLLYFLANGTDVVWNNWLPKVTGTGENITLNNTIEAKMNFVYKGNTYQYSTTGYNLFKTPYNESSTTKNGITFTINEDGSIHVEGTATAKTLFLLRNRDITLDLSVGQTYTVATSGLGTIDSTVWLDTYGQTGNFLGRWSLTQNAPYTSAIAEAKDNKPTISIAVENGATVNTNIKVWIYKGSYDAGKGYDPYTNGASPNPDYPQDIHTVSGDNTIEVVGKNYCELEYTKMLTNGSGAIVNDNNSWTAIVDTTNISALNISGNYNLIYGSALRIGLFNEYPTLDLTGTRITSTQNETIDTSNYKYVLFSFLIVQGKTKEDIENSFKIEDTTPQTYPISLGNIELCKIGDYQDKIYKDNGKWYLNKQIGKVVLDGSRDYRKSNTYSNETYFCGYINDPIIQSVETADWYNNKFQKGLYINVLDKECMYIPNNQLHVRILASRLSENSANGFRQWLATQYRNNNPVIVYYVLATPTTTEITDTTLISQLEAIKKSYNTQTNISQTNDDKPFILDVVALGELEI